MIISPYNDDASNDIQLKVDQLRDTTTIDIHTQLRLWKETLYFRRQSIRDRSTADALKDFSGYGNSLLVSQFFIYCLFVRNKFIFLTGPCRS
jgi:hypothetical protein